MPPAAKASLSWVGWLASALTLAWLISSSALGNAYARNSEYQVTKTEVENLKALVRHQSDQIDDIHKWMLEGRRR